jgi:hypothetical protein
MEVTRESEDLTCDILIIDTGLIMLREVLYVELIRVKFGYLVTIITILRCQSGSPKV